VARPYVQTAFRTTARAGAGIRGTSSAGNLGTSSDSTCKLVPALETPRFDTKIAVVLRDDLAGWQRTNVTAFLVSGIAATDPTVVGERYEDGSGNTYLPMFRQPVLVFETDGERLRRAYERAQRRGADLAVFTFDLFATGHDEANRAAVAAVAAEELDLAGVALRADRKVVDRVVAGLTLHP
jgi:hypothetical protein